MLPILIKFTAHSHQNDDEPIVPKQFPALRSNSKSNLIDKTRNQKIVNKKFFVLFQSACILHFNKYHSISTHIPLQILKPIAVAYHCIPPLIYALRKYLSWPTNNFCPLLLPWKKHGHPCLTNALDPEEITLRLQLLAM